MVWKEGRTEGGREGSLSDKRMGGIGKRLGKEGENGREGGKRGGVFN